MPTLIIYLFLTLWLCIGVIQIIRGLIEVVFGIGCCIAGCILILSSYIVEASMWLFNNLFSRSRGRASEAVTLPAKSGE